MSLLRLGRHSEGAKVAKKKTFTKVNKRNVDDIGGDRPSKELRQKQKKRKFGETAGKDMDLLFLKKQKLVGETGNKSKKQKVHQEFANRDENAEKYSWKKTKFQPKFTNEGMNANKDSWGKRKFQRNFSNKGDNADKWKNPNFKSKFTIRSEKADTDMKQNFRQKFADKGDEVGKNILKRPQLKRFRKTEPGSENEIKRSKKPKRLQFKRFRKTEMEPGSENEIKRPKKRKLSQKERIKLKEEKQNKPKNNTALDYLTKWDIDKDNWSFSTGCQNWLLKNMYEDDKVPDDSFKTMLKYLVKLEGHNRQRTIEKTEKCIQGIEEKKDKCIQDTEEKEEKSIQNTEEKKKKCIQDTKKKKAKKSIQGTEEKKESVPSPEMVERMKQVLKVLT